MKGYRIPKISQRRPKTPILSSLPLVESSTALPCKSAKEHCDPLVNKAIMGACSIRKNLEFDNQTLEEKKIVSNVDVSGITGNIVLNQKSKSFSNEQSGKNMDDLNTNVQSKNVKIVKSSGHNNWESEDEPMLLYILSSDTDSYELNGKSDLHEESDSTLYFSTDQRSNCTSKGEAVRGDLGSFDVVGIENEEIGFVDIFGESDQGTVILQVIDEVEQLAEDMTELENPQKVLCNLDSVIRNQISEESVEHELELGAVEIVCSEEDQEDPVHLSLVDQRSFQKSPNKIRKRNQVQTLLPSVLEKTLLVVLKKCDDHPLMPKNRSQNKTDEKVNHPEINSQENSSTSSDLNFILEAQELSNDLGSNKKRRKFSKKNRDSLGTCEWDVVTEFSSVDAPQAPLKLIIKRRRVSTSSLENENPNTEDVNDLNEELSLSSMSTHDVWDQYDFDGLVISENGQYHPSSPSSTDAQLSQPCSSKMDETSSTEAFNDTLMDPPQSPPPESMPRLSPVDPLYAETSQISEVNSVLAEMAKDFCNDFPPSFCLKNINDHVSSEENLKNPLNLFKEPESTITRQSSSVSVESQADEDSIKNHYQSDSGYSDNSSSRSPPLLQSPENSYGHGSKIDSGYSSDSVNEDMPSTPTDKSNCNVNEVSSLNNTNSTSDTLTQPNPLSLINSSEETLKSKDSVCNAKLPKACLESDMNTKNKHNSPECKLMINLSVSETVEHLVSQTSQIRNEIDNANLSVNNFVSKLVSDRKIVENCSTASGLETLLEPTKPSLESSNIPNNCLTSYVEEYSGFENFLSDKVIDKVISSETEASQGSEFSSETFKKPAMVANKELNSFPIISRESAIEAVQATMIAQKVLDTAVESRPRRRKYNLRRKEKNISSVSTIDTVTNTLPKKAQNSVGDCLVPVSKLSTIQSRVETSEDTSNDAKCESTNKNASKNKLVKLNQKEPRMLETPLIEPNSTLTSKSSSMSLSPSPQLSSVTPKVLNKLTKSLQSTIETPQVFTNLSLERIENNTEKKETKDNYKCSQCEKGFEHTWLLRRHKKTHTSPQRVKYLENEFIDIDCPVLYELEGRRGRKRKISDIKTDLQPKTKLPRKNESWKTWDIMSPKSRINAASRSIAKSTELHELQNLEKITTGSPNRSGTLALTFDVAPIITPPPLPLLGSSIVKKPESDPKLKPLLKITEAPSIVEDMELKKKFIKSYKIPKLKKDPIVVAEADALRTNSLSFFEGFCKICGVESTFNSTKTYYIKSNSTKSHSCLTCEGDFTEAEWTAHDLSCFTGEEFEVGHKFRVEEKGSQVKLIEAIYGIQKKRSFICIQCFNVMSSST